MEDRGKSDFAEGEPSNLVALQEARLQRYEKPVAFNRRELDQILRIYGFMVAANEWRDYAIGHTRDRAVFSVFRRTSETPLYQIVKEPKLARRQGAWALVNAAGIVLKRGHELARVLAMFDRPLKLVKG